MFAPVLHSRKAKVCPAASGKKARPPESITLLKIQTFRVRQWPGRKASIAHLGFPYFCGDEVLGVLDFFSRGNQGT